MDKKSTLRSVKEHIKKHHKKYLLGGFGIYGLIKAFIFFFGLLIGVNGLGVEGVEAADENECMDGSWDNENFLDEVFWSKNPNNDDIKCALFGSGDGDKTAYTDGWGGLKMCECVYSEMKVIRPHANEIGMVSGVIVGPRSSESEQLPDYLNNSIYIITGEISRYTGINMGHCSAVISQSGAIIKFNTTGDAIEITGTCNILDKLSIQNTQTTLTGDGIKIGSQYNTFNGINVYNFGNGIVINGNKFFANNLKIFNSINGVIQNGLYSSINNSQIFNNNVGIKYSAKGNANLYNNIALYNNSVGLYSNEGYVATINNMSLYNNVWGLSGVTQDNFIYGTQNYTGNNQFGGDLVGSEIFFLGLQHGVINSMDTSWDYITNVKTGAGNSGYFLDWKSPITSLIGVNENKVIDNVYGYSYGKKMIHQSQPLILGESNIWNWGNYDNHNYIGSYVKATDGSLEYPQYSSTYTTVTGHSSDVANYSIFGDVVSYWVDKEINMSTNIELENSGENIVITQLLSGAHSKNFMDRYGSNFEDGQYFATHFQSTVTKDTTPPTCTITQGACTSGTLILTLNVSEPISVPNGWNGSAGDTIFTKQVTSNGTTGVIVTDLAGNTGSCSTGVTNYDNQAPTTAISSITHNWNCTSGNVTVNFQTNTNGCNSTNTTYYCTGTNTCTPSIVGSSVTFSANAGQIRTGYVRFMSIDGLGNGETPKSTGLIYIDRVGPDAPTGLTSTCINGNCTFNWDDVTEDNGCSNVSGYVVQIYSGDSCGTDGKTAGSLQNPGGGSVEEYKSEGTLSSGSIRTNGAGYTTGGFENGQTYSWRVRTLDVLGNPGAWSDCQSGTITPRELSCLDLDLWDNDNFLDSGFWNNYSGNTEIGHDQVKCALYGSGIDDDTAYTKGWSGWTWGDSCDVYNMNVVETGSLPATLIPNTVYVLNTGKVLLDGGVGLEMKKCNAIISKSGTILYTPSVTISQKGMINLASEADFGILDSLSFDGVNIIDGGTHAQNVGLKLGFSEGIRVFHFTLNSIKVYNLRYGIYSEVATSGHLLLNNIQAYNNGYGLFLVSLGWMSVNNIQSYNNNIGLFLLALSGTSLSNMQIFNNNFGIGSDYAISTLFNNIQIYNNITGFGLYTGWDNKYYGSLNIFGNDNYNTLPSGLTAGGSEYSSVGWTAGNFDNNGTVSWDLMTNPRDNSGSYLLNRGATSWSSLRGTGTIGDVTYYSYGSGIKTQIRPVYRNGSSLVTVGDYDSTKYIGSDLKKEEMGVNVSGNSVTITPTNGNIDKYSIYGNLTTGPLTHNNAGSGTQIPGEPDYVIGQIYSDDGGYFAEHAQIEMAGSSRSYCLDGWDNDNFLDEEFWNGTGNYTGWNSLTDSGQRDQAIICALYGSGEDDSTAYTKGWKEREGLKTSCKSISVVYTGSPLPQNLTPNTIYVIENTGFLVQSTAGIKMNKCNAIISQTGTVLFVDITTSPLINMSDKYDILDKLSLQSSRNIYGGRGNGIYQRSKNSTINGINIYNFNTGINIDEGYFFANNIKVYNNTVGISTNTNEKYSSFNNAQIFNNSYGLYYNAKDSNNLFSNLSTYNNDIGIYFGVNADEYMPYINNIRLYNNIWGVTGYIDSLKVYGKFNYTGDNDYSMPLGVYNQNGILETGEINSMKTSWDYITNVKTGAGNSGYFLDRKSSRQGLIGPRRLAPKVYGYSYGSGITLQKQPLILIDSGGDTFENWGSYKGNRYIGSYIDKVEGSLEAPNAIYNSEITVTGHSDNVLNYSIFGNVVSYSVNNIINTSTDIELENTGENVIITQLLSGAHSKNFMDRYGSNFEDGQYYATHFQREVHLNRDTTPPICQLTIQQSCTSGTIYVILSGLSDDITGYNREGFGGTWNYSWTGQATMGFQQNGIVTGYVVDAAGNTGLCTGNITEYDGTPPTITGGTFTGDECTTITGFAVASDSGCSIDGAHNTDEGYTGYSWTVFNTGIYSDIQSEETYNVSATDHAGNTSFDNVIFQWFDVVLTGNWSTGIGEIGEDGYQINNWTGLFNSTAGSCESITLSGSVTCSSGFYRSGNGNSGTIFAYPWNTNTTGVCTGIVTDGDTTQTGIVNFEYTVRELSCNIQVASLCSSTGVTLTMSFTGANQYNTGSSRTDTGGNNFYSWTVTHTGTYTGYVKYGNRTGFCTGVVTENNLDQLSPTFNDTPNTFTGYECENIYGYVSATDSGCASGNSLTYSRSGNYVRNPNNTIFQSGENMTGFYYTGGNRTGTNVTGTLNVYVSDSLGNSGNSTQVNFVWLDTGVTLATGQITIPVITGDNQYTTGNVIDIFGAIEGACLSGNISVYSVSCSGNAASIFTGAGNTITITGANNYSGEVVCNVVFTDDDGKYATGEIIVPIQTKSLYCLDFWNNDNFLTGRFWSGWSELTGEYRRQALICALYGSGSDDPTAYTTGWYNWNWGNTTSGCNVLAMGVIEISTLPTTLDENTVYVLTGDQTTTGVTLNRCTAIVTSGGYTVSSGGIQITGNYSIIDSLFLNGEKEGEVGIYISTDNITMNFVKIYNFDSLGIENIGDYVILNNTQLFNNTAGLLSNNGILSINNSQIYNNNKAGLDIFHGKFLVNNSYIYNNNEVGLIAKNANGLLNDVMIFNNQTGIELNNSTTMTGYGSLEYFGNGDNGTVLNSIGHGTSPFAGWLDLDINTGKTVAYNFMTMPMATGRDDSNYLYDWSFNDNWANSRGSSDCTSNVDHFSYGINITRYDQAVALKQNNNIAKPGLEIPNRYIGSQMPRATFEVQTIGSDNTYDILATGATSNVVTGYTINGGNLTGSHYTGINQWLYSISFTGSSPFNFVTIISPVYSEE